jgi:hypothetical protein
MPRSFAPFEAALKPHEDAITALDAAFMAETAEERAIITAAALRRAVAAQPHYPLIQPIMRTDTFYHCDLSSPLVADPNAARIAALNDRLRREGRGGAVLLTAGVQALSNRATVLHAVATFDAFTEDTDPWGEHDCATLTVGAARVMFKIDYYDRTLTKGSDDPSDPAKTRRVLTILLAEEY